MEGGVATPDSETILMDAGWAGFDGQDPARILKVLEEEVGKKQLDYFIASHFHRDHTGGIEPLSEMIPIGRFVYHGESVEAGWNGRADALWQSYTKTAADRRMQVEPSQRLPPNSTEFLLVVARSKFVAQPLAEAGPNREFRAAASKAVDRGEKGKSVGFLVRLGALEFLRSR